jgi:hypothetical protein
MVDAGPRLDVLRRVSQLAVEIPQIQELDLNPLLLPKHTKAYTNIVMLAPDAVPPHDGG